MNNFQKRLVHQFVRSEHPELATISRPGFIQVVGYDKEREDAVQKARNAAFDVKLTRQIGLRWLVEAMVRGDLSPIVPWNLQPVLAESKDRKPQFIGLFDRLKEKRTVLVGHNVFMDLVYFYACFFGKLPDQVEEFQRIVHDLFPIVVDTKYLATHSSDNPARSRSSLEDLDEELAEISVPLIGQQKHDSVQVCILIVNTRDPPKTPQIYIRQTSSRGWIRQLPNGESPHPFSDKAQTVLPRNRRKIPPDPRGRRLRNRPRR